MSHEYRILIVTSGGYRCLFDVVDTLTEADALVKRMARDGGLHDTDRHAVVRFEKVARP